MLRRFAPRARRIIERRKGESPTLQAYERTLVPAAERYMAAYDTAMQYQSVWRKEKDESQSAIVILSHATRSWRPLLAADVAGVALVKPAASLVADDVIREAEWLLAIVTDHRDGSGNPLAYSAEAQADLGNKLAAGRKESSEAEAADSLYQQYQAEVRRTAAEFDVCLKALRRTLAVIAGRNDRDYQKLRIQRASVSDEDDDAGDTPPPPPPAEIPPPAARRQARTTIPPV